MFPYNIRVHVHSSIVDQVCYNIENFSTKDRRGGGGRGGEEGGGRAKSGCRIPGSQKTAAGSQKAVVFLWRKASLTRGSNYRNREEQKDFLGAGRAGP